MGHDRLVMYHLFVIASIISAPLAAAASSSLVPIAIQGREHGEVRFNHVITIPTINDAGEIAFRASAEMAGKYLSRGPWIVSPSGEYANIAYSGMPAPGAEPYSFEDFAYMSSNAAGQSSFYGTLPAEDSYNPFAQNSGFWAANAAGELRLVARWGQPASGTTHTFTRPFTHPENYSFQFAISKLGQVAFVADTVDPNSSEPYGHGIWAENAAHELQLIAFKNYPVPGSLDGSVIRGIRGQWLEMTDAGRASFLAFWSGFDAEDEWKQGLWRQRDNGTLHRLIAEADPLPGWGVTRYLHDIDQFSMNNRGDAALLGITRQAPERHLVELQKGYWLIDSDGETTLIALDDAPVPEIESAQFALPSYLAIDPFGVRAKGILVNGKGDAAFMSAFKGPGITEANDTALWIRRCDGTLKLIAREGDPTPRGDMFASFLPGETSMSLNGQGQLVFIQNAPQALYAANQYGAVDVIAAGGDQVDVDPGPGIDFRVIESLSFLGGSGGEDGGRTGFNDRGQIAFRANFSWQEAGIFLSNAIAVPEPASAAFLLFAAVALSTRRIGRIYV